MTPYDNVKPRFVREWYLKLKQRMKALKAKREAESLTFENGEPSKEITKQTRADLSPQPDSDNDS